METPAPARLPKALIILALILTFVGFVVASYLSIEHFLNKIPPCSLTEGCETVLTSSYATVFGVPEAVWGALFYFGLFIAILYYQKRGNRRMGLLLTEIIGGGLAWSLYLLYVQVYIIKALCLYCLISDTVMLLLFITAIFIWRKTPQES